MTNNFYTQEYWESRKQVIVRQEGECRFCFTKENLHCHHINRTLPQDLLNRPENLVIVCEECHKKLTVLEKKGWDGRQGLEQIEMDVTYQNED